MQTVQHVAQSLEYSSALQSQITQVAHEVFQAVRGAAQPDVGSVTHLIDGWSENLERLLVHLAILLYLLKKGAAELAILARNAWKSLSLLGHVFAGIGRSVAAGVATFGRLAVPVIKGCRRAFSLLVQLARMLARRLN